MTRFVPVTVLVLLAALLASGLASGRVASADSGMLPNGATLTFDRLFIHEDGSPTLVEPKVIPDSLWNYFNLAHCQCSKAAPQGFVENEFAYLMTLQAQSAPLATDRELQFWVGLQCDSTNPDTRNANCHQVTTVASINSLLLSGSQVKIPVYDFMTPIRTSPTDQPDCTPAEQDGTLWAIAALAQGGSAYDFFQSKTIKIDSKPPELPTGFRASGGDGAVEISWKAPVSTLDTYGYQALCARADNDMPGKTSGKPDPRYMTAQGLCGIDQSINLAGTDISVTGQTTSGVTLPAGMKDLQPQFLCGEAFSPTAESLRIEGLQNGVEYKVVLLAVDKFQNASGTFFTSTITPVPSTDFWEDIHDRGSQVEGGLCLLAETYGDDSALTGALRAFRDDTLRGSRAGRWLADAYYATIGKLGGAVHGSIALRVLAGVALAPLVALALLWHWVTLPGLLGVIALAALGRRRRRLPRWLVRLVPAVGAAVIALSPGRAHAGGGYQPYWENTAIKDDDKSLADEPGLVTWHVGIRVGPYVPDIDKQFGGASPGPYEQMFGGYRILPMLDVDRILWSGAGQVGVGFSLGYMQKTARTFAFGSTPGMDRPRASDENKFRLVPMALTGTYRFTWLDDQYGIPVVPYVRAGLSYYLWWVSTSSGVAFVCRAGTADATCDKNKALGASLGYQGSIGLAIRAERIDAPTAMSMQQSGIQHAGVYAELSLANVDGFGSDKKLSVGDRTWFAGVDFEF